ncbi:TetR/AcrR family transcriptional regulator C-terminal ligand-binding domain-containing protein [Streptomyces sp. XH2]|uniref:TetR/AcrR family transcriptional regulator n=1 Tax=Streptomyces sp. XH2 TaxID=3412483 RepID=UPI003C7A1EE3
MEAVAERAWVNKTTIYRWWPSKEPLLRSALLHSQVPDVEIADTGSLRGDLVAPAGQMVRLVSDQRTSAVARAMLSDGGGGELALVARDFFADRLERESPLFARGELAADADPVLLIDLIAGAVWMRALLRRLPVEEGFVESVVDAVVPRLQVSGPPGPRP